MDKKERIKQLTEQLNNASYTYYNTGYPAMEDSEFDLLLDELQRLENEIGFSLANSPTRKAGSKVAKEQKKIKHEHLMLSLDKVHTVEEIRKFLGCKDAVASVKLDGLTMSATYIDGKLTRLETRGDGDIGVDIMIHKNSIKGLPHTIIHKGKYVVDGECIVPYDSFERINAELYDNEKFSNPRNMASGSLNLLDSNISAKRGLRFVVWNVIEDSEGFSDSMCVNLMNASNFGFDIVPYEIITTKTKDELDYVLDNIKHLAKILNLPMDGCVIALNDITYGKSLGKTAKFFNSSVAFKYEDEDKETILRDIEWTMGKSGTLCPTAVFDTVELEGTKVNRASLHNISICKSLELGIGDTISVYKANMIIPQVRNNLTRSNTFTIPDKCPICGADTKIVKQNDSEVLECTSPNCRGKLLGELSNFVSKQGMDINGLSETTLEQLINRGYVQSMQDIYHLSSYKKELSTLPKMGAKSVAKLLEAIEKSRKTTLDKFLTALSIPGVGKNTAKDISSYCNGDVDLFFTIMNNNASAFSVIDGIGGSVVQSLNDWWSVNDVIAYMLLEELDIEKPVEENNVGNSLDGKTFVVTGSVHHFKNRSELQKKIESLGGKVAGSVSKNTFALLNNDVNSSSSKNVKAKQLGVPIWSEEKFMEYIGE